MNLENINIKTFNTWAIKGKDKGMERGHAPAVEKMFELINHNTPVIDSTFNVLDLGSGNGWVVRKFLKNENCNYALGIDGAPAMIDKAKKLDSAGNYINADIEIWNCNEKFDIIFSMETFYYFENIDKVLLNIYNNIIAENGFFIIGIDHYLENKPSLNWDKEFDLSINTLSINHWVRKIENAGFSNIQHTIYGSKEEWNGTLILYATKK